MGRHQVVTQDLALKQHTFATNLTPKSIHIFLKAARWCIYFLIKKIKVMIFRLKGRNFDFSLQKHTSNYFCIFKFSTGVCLFQRDICVFEAVDQPLLCATKAVPVPYQVQDVRFTGEGYGKDNKRRLRRKGKTEEKGVPPVPLDL